MKISLLQWLLGGPICISAVRFLKGYLNSSCSAKHCILIYTYPSRRLLVETKQWKHQNDVKFVQSQEQKRVDDVILVSLLLTLNRYHTLFFCLQC